jgi:putative membrane protein
MFLKRGQLPILLTNLIYLAIFSYIYISKQNYEFIAYVFIILFFFIIILATNKAVNYPNLALWGLTLWGFMHMLGGTLPVGGGRLYDLIIIPITKDVFRYDQLVHIVGFGVSTLVMYSLFYPLAEAKIQSQWVKASIIIVMAGLGVGALNEIIEFLIQVIVPNTGVGGYINTSLDLVSDIIGALFALIYIRINNWEI